MKTRTLKALTLLVAALALITFFDRPRVPEPVGTRTRLLPGWDAKTVREITLAGPGRPLVRLVAGASGASSDYALAEPVSTPADPEAVRDLLGTLEYVSWRRRVPAGDPTQSAARGLDAKTRRTIKVTFTNGTSVELYVGRTESTLERTWMARSGMPDHLLVDDYFARALDRDVEALRRRNPLPVGAGPLPPTPERGVMLRAAAAPIVLYGDPLVVGLGDGSARADAELGANLLRKLSDLRLAAFLPTSTAPTALAPTLEVRALGHVLSAFGPCPDHPELRVVQSELGMGCVRADVLADLERLAQDPLAWVSREVLPYGLRELRAITLVRGSNKLALVRDASVWRRSVEHPADPNETIDDEALEAWWRDLASFAATAVVPVTASATPPPDAAVLRLEPDQGPFLVLWIAQGGPAERVLVQRAGENVALVVHKDVAHYFEPDPIQFASHQLFDFEESALRTLKLVRREGDGVVTESAARGTTLDEWLLSSPLEAKANAEAVASMRETLAHLRAKRVVAARAEATFGLEQPVISLSVTIDPPPTQHDAQPEAHTLELGKTTADGECFARVGGKPSVYLLDAPSCASLSTWLAPLDVFASASEPAALVFGTTRFERHGPGWYGPQGERLSEAKADALGAAIDALAHAPRVLGYGKPKDGRALTITWVDGKSSELWMSKNEYGLRGGVVRYELPKGFCDTLHFAAACR